MVILNYIKQLFKSNTNTVSVPTRHCRDFNKISDTINNDTTNLDRLEALTKRLEDSVKRGEELHTRRIGDNISTR